MVCSFNLSQALGGAVAMCIVYFLLIDQYHTGWHWKVFNSQTFSRFCREWMLHYARSRVLMEQLQC